MSAEPTVTSTRTRAIVEATPIIDADTHVIEPPDLFTSRVSVQKWGELVPHVRWDAEAEEEAWYFGDKKIYAAGLASGARWHEYPPDHPRRLTDSDDRNWDAARRLIHMDDYGIEAQVLYPNIGVFQVNEYIGMRAEAELVLACVQAYNDFLVEWSAIAPDRYIPLMTVPFWDLDATMHEMERAHEAGHKGIVFPARMEDFGLPALHEPHWNRFFAAAEEMELSINFHIGSGNIPMFGTAAGRHLGYAWTGTMLFNLNASAIASLIFGGICQRFPKLDFVSVESGVGWIPFLLESMDWQFHNSGVVAHHPELELLPSEYFARQIYSCFWFERGSAKAAIEQLGSTHVLFETDFPHPTGITPGPASSAMTPREQLVASLDGMPAEDIRNVMHDNAARLYKLEGRADRGRWRHDGAMDVAASLVSQFDRMVKRDGGAVSLVGVVDGVIRVAYRPGADLTCDTDACVLPHLELQQLMSETLARRDASLQVVVDLAR